MNAFGTWPYTNAGGCVGPLEHRCWRPWRVAPKGNRVIRVAGSQPLSTRSRARHLLRRAVAQPASYKDVSTPISRSFSPQHIRGHPAPVVWRDGPGARFHLPCRKGVRGSLPDRLPGIPQGRHSERSEESPREAQSPAGRCKDRLEDASTGGGPASPGDYSQARNHMEGYARAGALSCPGERGQGDGTSDVWPSGIRRLPTFTHQLVFSSFLSPLSSSWRTFLPSLSSLWVGSIILLCLHP